MKLSDILAPLLASKADPESILSIVRAYEAEVEQGKEKARERWRSWKERNPTNVGKRLQTAANVDKQLTGEGARVEDKTLTSEIEPQESKKASHAQSDVAAFRARLAPLVSAELLEEFIKVRRRKRGAITGFAAGLFVADAETVGMTPQAAATECVRSSWITVKPEYYANRIRPGPKPNAALDTVDNLLEKLDAIPSSEAQANPPYPRLVAFSGSG